MVNAFKKRVTFNETPAGKPCPISHCENINSHTWTYNLSSEYKHGKNMATTSKRAPAAKCSSKCNEYQKKRNLKRQFASVAGRINESSLAKQGLSRNDVMLNTSLHFEACHHPRWIRNDNKRRLIFRALSWFVGVVVFFIVLYTFHCYLFRVFLPLSQEENVQYSLVSVVLDVLVYALYSLI